MVFNPAPAPNRLKVLRAERGVSQRAVASSAGIQFDRYWRIENGYAPAAAEEQAELARVLGVEIPDIWTAERDQVVGA